VLPAPLRRLIAAACVLCASRALAADAPPPVWEAGPGLALLGYPDYRGATHYNFQPLPLPYFVYRGERLRVNREGIRAALLESERLELSLSAAFALPGHDRGDDSPRAGMPKLMPTFEIGPSLDWWLDEDAPEQWSWRLRLPVRAVAASDFSRLEQAGWLAHPHLQTDRRSSAGPWSFHYEFSGGALFATRKYHDYFYEVQPQYATATRPAYEPGGGYSGARLSAFASVGRGRWKLGLGVLDDWLAGARFIDSPLVQTRNAIVVGLGLTYRLWQSDATVADEQHE
jgi:outer membrane scaffolding protein for murein synthesis (MipA/OmpV family)